MSAIRSKMVSREPSIRAVNCGCEMDIQRLSGRDGRIRYSADDRAFRAEFSTVRLRSRSRDASAVLAWDAGGGSGCRQPRATSSLRREHRTGTRPHSQAVRHARELAADVTSWVLTLKPARVHRPNEVTIATSVASRPRAIRMRPMRGVLWRASNVYQPPLR